MSGKSGLSGAVYPDQKIADLVRENGALKAELSAFKAAHDIGRPEDGYREMIWREASEFYEEEYATDFSRVRQQARREALEEAGRKAALIGATVQIDTAPVEYVSGYQDAAQNIFNAIRALAAKEDGDV